MVSPCGGGVVHNYGTRDTCPLQGSSGYYAILLQRNKFFYGFMLQYDGYLCMARSSSGSSQLQYLLVSGSRWSRKSVLAVTACRCLATPTVSVITLAGLSWCDGAANYGIVEQRKRERWMILLLRLYVLGARS